MMILERRYKNYINGEWIEAESGESVSSTNPANTKEIVGYFPLSSKSDLDRAAAAAKQAKQGWRKLSGAARGDALYKTAAILESRLEEIAETMSREMGKTLAESKGETMRGVALLRYFAGEGMRGGGDVIPSSDAEALMFTTRVPLGVVGIIAPWNFPVAIPIWKIAPALIYGNTVVFKPAEDSSVTAAKVVECFADAGLPVGVINLVCGDGAVVGSALAEHPDVNGLSFTGSNGVGRQIAKTAIQRGAKYQLEMGGKNPVIIASDADLDLAVEGTISGGMRSTGQKCTATSRVIVERSVYESFREKLLKRVQELTVGNGMEASTWMGPVVNEKQWKKVNEYIQIGIDEGAELLCGGVSSEAGFPENAYFVQPTVFDGVEPSMRIAREEIFGPVLALIPVDSFEQGLELANDSDYGLSASVYTRDISTMLTFIGDMDAGLVRVNAETAGVELQAPFGGMKQSSSHSREQGQAAKEFFTDIRTVFVKG